VHHSPLVVAIVHLLLTGLSVLIVGKLLPGVRVKSYGSAVLFAFVIGLLNAVAWTFLAPLSITFTVFTLGVGALMINGLLFLLADAVVPGVEISGCITAVLASLGVTFVNWAMHFVVGHWAP
jgi:putative membrane protein